MAEHFTVKGAYFRQEVLKSSSVQNVLGLLRQLAAASNFNERALLPSIRSVEGPRFVAELIEALRQLPVPFESVDPNLLLDKALEGERIGAHFDSLDKGQKSKVVSALYWQSAAELHGKSERTLTLKALQNLFNINPASIRGFVLPLEFKRPCDVCAAPATVIVPFGSSSAGSRPTCRCDACGHLDYYGNRSTSESTPILNCQCKECRGHVERVKEEIAAGLVEFESSISDLVIESAKKVGTYGRPGLDISLYGATVEHAWESSPGGKSSVIKGWECIVDDHPFNGVGLPPAYWIRFDGPELKPDWLAGMWACGAIDVVAGVADLSFESVTERLNAAVGDYGAGANGWYESVVNSMRAGNLIALAKVLQGDTRYADEVFVNLPVTFHVRATDRMRRELDAHRPTGNRTPAQSEPRVIRDEQSEAVQRQLRAPAVAGESGIQNVPAGFLLLTEASSGRPVLVLIASIVMVAAESVGTRLVLKIGAGEDSEQGQGLGRLASVTLHALEHFGVVINRMGGGGSGSC